MTKRLKAELMAALSMLIIAALMLTSTSFAWMTISKTASVEKLAVSMGTTGNMEIAMAQDGKYGEAGEVSASDSGIQTSWGAKVTKFGTATGINWPTIVSKDATNVSQFFTTKFDETGRTAGVTQALTPIPGQINNGIIPINAMVDTDGDSSTAGVSKVIGAGYAVWLRSNQHLTDVKFTLDTENIDVKRADGSSADITGDDVTVAVSLYKFPENTADDTLYSTITPVVINSGDEFELYANTEAMALISIGVKGDKLIAADFTSGAALTITGVEVKFSSAQLEAY